MVEEKFEVKDSRKKGWYWQDNEYVDIYARICGASATVAYQCLCRHADKNGECFPSINTMSEKMGVGRDTIIKGIKILIEYNIISKIHERKKADKTWLNNRYFMNDKSVWKVPQVDYSDTGSQVDHSDLPQVDHSDTNKTNLIHNKTNPFLSSSRKKERDEVSNSNEGEEADVTYEEIDEDGNPIKQKKVRTRVPVDMALVDHKIAQERSSVSKTIKSTTSKTKRVVGHSMPFNQEEEMNKWKHGTNVACKIIVLFYERKGFVFRNREQWDASIPRNMKAANTLKGYSPAEVNDAIDFVVEQAEKMGYEWTLESVSKAIINTANKG